MPVKKFIIFKNFFRLLPEIWNFETIKSLIQQCDDISPQHNALGNVLYIYANTCDVLYCMLTLTINLRNIVIRSMNFSI
jgi:hypothetical protein